MVSWSCCMPSLLSHLHSAVLEVLTLGLLSKFHNQPLLHLSVPWLSTALPRLYLQSPLHLSLGSPLHSPGCISSPLSICPFALHCTPQVVSPVPSPTVPWLSTALPRLYLQSPLHLSLGSPLHSPGCISSPLSICSLALHCTPLVVSPVPSPSVSWLSTPLPRLYLQPLLHLSVPWLSTPLPGYVSSPSLEGLVQSHPLPRDFGSHTFTVVPWEAVRSMPKLSTSLSGLFS